MQTKEVATQLVSSPSVLVAILISARKTGDRVLEDVAKLKLENDHGVRIRFLKNAEAKRG